MHPRYNPEKDGRPQRKDCPGCDSLWVVHLYCGIARRKAEAGEGILVSRSETPASTSDPPAVATNEDADAGGHEEAGGTADPETSEIS